MSTVKLPNTNIESSLNSNSNSNIIETIRMIELIQYILSNIPIKILVMDENDDIIYTNIESVQNSIGEDFKNVLKIKHKNKFKEGGKLFIENMGYVVKNHDYNRFKILYLFPDKIGANNVTK